MSKKFIFIHALMIMMLAACQPARREDPKNLDKPTETPKKVVETDNPATSEDDIDANADFKNDAEFPAMQASKTALKKFQIVRNPVHPSRLTFTVEPKETNGVKSFTIHALAEDLLDPKKNIESDLELTAREASLSDMMTSLFAGKIGLKSVKAASGLGATTDSGKFIAADGKKFSIQSPALDSSTEPKANAEAIEKAMSDLIKWVSDAVAVARDTQKADLNCADLDLSGSWSYHIAVGTAPTIDAKLTSELVSSKDGVVQYAVEEDIHQGPGCFGKASQKVEKLTYSLDTKNCILSRLDSKGQGDVYLISELSPNAANKKQIDRVGMQLCADKECKGPALDGGRFDIIEEMVRGQTPQKAPPQKISVSEKDPKSCEGMKLDGTWAYAMPSKDPTKPSTVVSYKILVDSKAKVADGEVQYAVQSSVTPEGKTEPVTDAYNLLFVPKSCILKQTVKTGATVSYKVIELLHTVKDYDATHLVENREITISVCADAACTKLSLSGKPVKMVAETVSYIVK